MDGQRFDELTKKLAATVSRRGVLRTLAGGVAAAGAALSRRGSSAAPSTCAVGCAGLPGPQKAACLQACRRCGGDFDRVCFDEGPFGPTAFVCCPEGTFCFFGEGLCCEVGTEPCFGPGGEAFCCPEGTFCNFDLGQCEELTLCPTGEPADNCFAGVFTDCDPTGACGLVDDADSDQCNCIERTCTEIPCATDADCAEIGSMCVTVPGCCLETTFCAVPCGSAGLAPTDAPRWGK
jgi:hypothetical protein